MNDDDDEDEEQSPLPEGNYMTPHGYDTLKSELRQLLRVERPRVVEVVSWAAGNGDRSENGDYLYNKKRLREIDRRIRYLTRRTEDANVVDPRRQQGLDKVFFGATVTYAGADDIERTVQLVGVDEADLDHGKINWLSPLARAVMKAGPGDTVRLRTEEAVEAIEIVDVRYELDDGESGS